MNLLSDPIISAFCSAAAVHVISSQVFSLFDVDSTAGENEPPIPFEIVRVSNLIFIIIMMILISLF